MSLQHVVVSGDCLSSIAAHYGFADWRVIYDAPENADFKAKRSNPNLIYPGDVLVIPEKQEKTVDVATGASHRFQLKRSPTWLRLEVRVEGPHRYVLHVGSEKFSGTTTGDSPLEHRINPEARRGRIQLWPDADDAPDSPPADALVWKLQIGALDPIEEVSGIQGRLSNLGYYHGPWNGEVDELTAAAIRWFQEDHDLDSTGEIDQRLRDELGDAHDGS
jgi:N-acetylmuramoyl-L-alanine amidase